LAPRYARGAVAPSGLLRSPVPVNGGRSCPVSARVPARGGVPPGAGRARRPWNLQNEPNFA